jgi:putative ABC transport system permease protein
MMMGLALMVSIWTNGKSIMRDWLGALEFPDAFVSGISLSEKTLDRIKAARMPDGTQIVNQTCAITLQSFHTDAFGISAFDNTSTTFVAFEPEPFFRMTRLRFIEGDPQTAERRLMQGGAVLVANEFKVTRGYKVGDHITLKQRDKSHEFEIVGVVSSPGLEIASKFFDIGEEYLDNAVNAVFGSRDDLRTLFGNTAINLIQLDLNPAVNDAAAMKEIRKLAGFEVVAAGSGREIKAEIRRVLTNSLFVFSVVAVASMLVACFGVANLIIAGIQARQFEFGVLRAIGAQRGLLTRLVLGEAALIALTACIAGTVMGVQASWAGQRMYQVLLGLVLTLRVPVGATAAGWAILTAITLGAAGPAVWALARKHPRELLAAVKG